MRKIVPIGAALSLGLAACTTTTSAPEGSSPPSSPVTSIAMEVQSVCAQAAPLVALVPAVGVYATAFCGAANLVANASPADLAWISNILGELKGNVKPVVAS